MNYMASEAQRIARLCQHTSQQHSVVLHMLFPQGSAVAARLVADLVPPDMIASGIPFDSLTFERCLGEGTRRPNVAAAWQGPRWRT